MFGMGSNATVCLLMSGVVWRSLSLTQAAAQPLLVVASGLQWAAAPSSCRAMQGRAWQSRHCHECYCIAQQCPSHRTADPASHSCIALVLKNWLLLHYCSLVNSASIGSRPWKICLTSHKWPSAPVSCHSVGCTLSWLLLQMLCVVVGG